jgi:replicative DNA helicase Mcm
LRTFIGEAALLSVDRMAQAANQELVDRFEEFYRRYYSDDVAELARKYPRESKSLHLDWRDLYQMDPDLADDFINHPDDLKEAAEEALRLYDLPVDVSLGQAHVRVYGLEESTEIRAIRAEHLNSLVNVQGMVRKATDVRPKIQRAVFVCQRCGAETEVPQGDAGFQEPYQCESCERQGPFKLDPERSEFVDSQKLRIQESPEGLAGGETPQSIDVHITDDITGEVTPGDHVTVSGVLRLDQSEGSDESPVFDLYMEGLSVVIEDEEFEEMNITEEDKQQIVEISERENLYEQMVDSMAPSIYGHREAKLAMILQLFSGVTKHLPDESRIRGDLHMLLIGDPGTGKSALISYVQNIAPRSVYTSGKGSSAAGLTAAAVRDDFGDGQQWTLEAGALVLADQGVAAVDELDKMSGDDRSAMHEALEQQSYHPNSEVLLADGRRVEIGEFVDDQMETRSDEVLDGVNCEILPVEDVRVHSVDLDERETTKTPVDRVSRHEAPDEFVRVTFSNGRDVLVTPEHPMFTAAGGSVETIDAQNIEEGAFVPAPRKLPNSSAAVELDSEPHVGKERGVTLPEELSEPLAEILGFLVAEGHSYVGSSHEIGFSNQDQRLLDRVSGLMHDEFGLESTPTTNAAGTVTHRWISTKLYRWFEENFPEVMETARDKRIPASVLGGSEEHIRRFLVGAFAGDGGVESEAMSFSTASPRLAEDYADALSKLGVASRIHHDTAEDCWKTYVMGDSTEQFVTEVVEPADDRYDQAKAFVERSNETRRHHDVLPTSAAREIRDLRKLTGLGLTGQFRPHLDEGFGVQTETVAQQLEQIRDRVVDVRDALETADGLGDVRAAADWSGRQVAERIDETASTIHYAESGGYDEETRTELVSRARAAIQDALEEAEQRAAALDNRCDFRYYRVTDVETVPNEGEYATDWVYDVTVEPTNTFVSQGVVLHNSISISKAGINATLKARCSLLGAANPKYGRFDQYEPIGEQIDLEPALISRFDLIFTVTDKPDPEEDAKLAEHILQTNYAGELNTQREQLANSNHTADEVAAETDTVAPAIEASLLRKYIAYSRRNCYPTMTDEAKQAIEEFYVDLRAEGQGEDAPVPVTARQLEALVRLAEASARVRLSDTAEVEDAERVISIVRSCLQDIGVDPETGEYDADVVETGRSKTQRDRVKNVKAIIKEIEDEFDEGAPVDEVLDRAEEVGMDADKARHEIDKLKEKGELYQPNKDHLRSI